MRIYGLWDYLCTRGFLGMDNDRDVQWDTDGKNSHKTYPTARMNYILKLSQYYRKH